MRARAFTLIEMSICMLIISAMVPFIYVLWRQMESTQVATMSRVEASRWSRLLSEELRDDARARAWRGETGVTFAGSSAGGGGGADGCGDVSYELRGSSVLRVGAGCPAQARTVALGVRSLTRAGDAVRVSFAGVDGGRDVDIVIGLVPRSAP